MKILLCSTLAVLGAATPVWAADSRNMKIEQAIGGLNGDWTLQAIQLRMRTPDQTQVTGARLVAWDAAGTNPVVLIDFPTDVANGEQGARILVVSPAFAAAESTVHADFTMTNTIPYSYFAAGRLTYEVGGTVFWSLAWGGSAYTGPHAGTITNDNDGHFGPQFGGALPWSSGQALQFMRPDPTGSAVSIRNSTDYGITPGGAAFTNNSGTTADFGQADLSVSLFDLRDPLMPSTSPGLMQNYIVALNNAGPSAAIAVEVLVNLPVDAVFQYGSAGWTCAYAGPGQVRCRRPSLPMGQAPELRLIVGFWLALGPVTSSVTVSAINDVALANNSDSEDTFVGTMTVQADLAVTMSDGGLEGRFGYPLTYTITATNNGPASISGAWVSDYFPDALTDVTWTCSYSGGAWCPASGVGDLYVPGVSQPDLSLPVGGRATFTATGTVLPGFSSPVFNNAIIWPFGQVDDPNPANDYAYESTPVGPIRFYTTTPCRLADTRDPAGLSGGPGLAANAVRNFPAAGLCGLPPDTRVVAINVAVVGPSEPGNLRLFPAGAAAPVASALNFSTGITRANSAIIRLGADGRIAVQCDMPVGTGTAHMLMDVTGYFR